MATWEDQFRSWAEGPGDSETTRCENAERMIRKAITANHDLAKHDIDVFSQGSFRNVTNIPQESDVDVSACLTSTMYYQIPTGADPKDFGLNSPATYDFGSYRRSVVTAISDYFDAKNITVGNKAIRVHSNTYRVDADVVPNWLFREYFANGSTRDGVKFIANDGKVVVNYPKQHVEQAIAKNARTSRRFKRIARILKSLQLELLDQKTLSERLPSFLLESLAFNVPDDQFGHARYEDDVKEILRHIYLNTRPEDDASKWVEANNVKYLFHQSQPWTKSQANAFALASWRYVGFA